MKRLTHIVPDILCLSTMLVTLASAEITNEMPMLCGSDTLTVDLGTLHVGENRTVSYSVTNSTEKLLVIDEIESSCDCMTVLEHPFSIEPQDVGKVLINIFGEKDGSYAFAVALQFEDGSQRYLVAQVSVKEKSALKEAPATVTMAPPRVGKKWYPGKPKPIAPEVLRRVTRNNASSLYTTLKDVRSSVLNGDIRVVDLRSEQKFRQCRLPGSLNMTPVEARTKAFLKRGPVLLVDEGWGRTDTERACAAIQKAGNADCFILFGGINIWVHNGNNTEGPGISLGKIAVVSPREFLSVRGLDSWVIFTESGQSHEKARKWLPESIKEIPATGTQLRRLLLLDDTKVTNNLLSGNTVLFRLEGGIAAIEKEYRKMTAMRYTQTHTTSSKISTKRWQVLKSGCGCGS